MRNLTVYILCMSYIVIIYDKEIYTLIHNKDTLSVGRLNLNVQYKM